MKYTLKNTMAKKPASIDKFPYDGGHVVEGARSFPRRYFPRRSFPRVFSPLGLFPTGLFTARSFLR